MVSAQARIHPRKCEILWDFAIKMDHLILTRKQDLVVNNKKKKKRTCFQLDFTIPANH